MSFAEKIKKLRKEHNWSQDMLAHKIGIHGRHLSKYEAGQSLPNADTLLKISDVLDVSIDYLLRDVDTDHLSVNIRDRILLRAFEAADQMDENDKTVIKTVIDAFIKKRKVEEMMVEDITSA